MDKESDKRVRHGEIMLWYNVEKSGNFWDELPADESLLLSAAAVLWRRWEVFSVSEQPQPQQTTATKAADALTMCKPGDQRVTWPAGG